MSDILKTMTDRGYKEFEPTRFHSAGIRRCFQKRFDDDTGKRYFIDVHEWEPFSGCENVVPYEYEIQLYQKGTHNPINLLFFAGWDLDSVEEHVKNMFESGMYDYYERWEDC